MGAMQVHLRANDWIWSAHWEHLAVAVDEGTAHITLNGTRFRLQPAEEKSQRPVKDALGAAIETLSLLGAEDLPVQVVLRLRHYEERALIGMQGEVVNHGDQPCFLEDLELVTQIRVDLKESGRNVKAYVERSLGHPSIEPLITRKDKEAEDVPLEVASQGMVTLAGRSGHSFTAGFISAEEHRPVVRLSYVPVTDEIFLSGIARFNGRRVDPGERVQTGRLMMQATDDPLKALEAYGALLTQLIPPRETPPTIGWCSWYAIRMPISYAFTMDNARVVVERFRDLGMDLMLLDHGWQQGDICGDWVPDPEDFPGGLEALAKGLNALGLKLGLWIAPTDVARSSRLFREHPEWMLRDRNGRPATNWRWYWEPKPLECELDATQQEAYEYIVETFRALTREGAVYYKIDFIAAAAREDLYPADTQYVRGWTPLRRAMEAVREGAGTSTYVRYCQTPPLLSTGLADGVFATNDTLDAGAHTWPVLRQVFCMSAAQYWLHGRLYNHDACDLSVRAQGGTEECRLRATMLALSGSSIMFSDDLTKLPEERIRLMQQCMPGFAQAARPLNLFTSELPDIWHLHAERAGLEWELLALFNFGEASREIEVTWEALGLSPDQSYLIREFWTGGFEGTHSGKATLIVPGLAVRLYSFWPVADRPQYVGTDLHLSQGLAELSALGWDEKQGRLSGTLKRARGIRGHTYIHLPASWAIRNASSPVYRQNRGLCVLEIHFEESEQDWEVLVQKA